MENTESKSSDFTNLKNIGIVFFSWMFGLKNVLTLFTGYSAYKTRTTNSLYMFTFMLTWVIFSFSSALMYIFMTTTYNLIYHKEKIVEMMNNTKTTLKNIEGRDNNDITNDEKRILERYQMFSNYYEKLFSYAESMKTKISSNQLYQNITSKVDSVSNMYIKYNLEFYLQVLEKYIGILAEKLKLVLLKIPYVKQISEGVNDLSNNNTILEEERQEDIIFSPPNLPPGTQLPLPPNIQIPTLPPNVQLPNLPLPNFPSNLSPPDFSNMKPPTEEDMIKLGDMMKMFGELNSMLDEISNKPKED